VPSITKNGPKKFQKTPPNVSSSQKKTQTIAPNVPSRRKGLKKKFSNNSQMYLQENKRVKKSFK